MLHAMTRVNGVILWANMHLLFWLSLMPFATGWVSENHMATLPTALYGGTLLMAAIAYFLLQSAIIRSQGVGSVLAKAIGKDVKGKISPLLYVTGIGLAFIYPWLANAVYAFVALMWLIPDQRIEKALRKKSSVS